MAMLDIVLTTLNVKFIYAAFGLRYLFANLGELQSRATIAEFDINQHPLDIVEALLARLDVFCNRWVSLSSCLAGI